MVSCNTAEARPNFKIIALTFPFSVNNSWYTTITLRLTTEPSCELNKTQYGLILSALAKNWTPVSRCSHLHPWPWWRRHTGSCSPCTWSPYRSPHTVRLRSPAKRRSSSCRPQTPSSKPAPAKKTPVIKREDGGRSGDNIWAGSSTRGWLFDNINCSLRGRYVIIKMVH